MFERDTLKKLASEETQIREWLAENKESFSKALGLWCAEDDLWILVLAKMRDFFGGKWPGYKDEIDRAGCDALSLFLHKQEVDPEELRLAVGLLVQRFNAACDRIHSLESRARLPRTNPRYIPRRIIG